MHFSGAEETIQNQETDEKVNGSVKPVSLSAINLEADTFEKTKEEPPISETPKSGEVIQGAAKLKRNALGIWVVRRLVDAETED